MIWLRSALFLAFFYFETLALLVPATWIRLVRPSRSLAVARVWGRVTLWGARVLCGITWRVEGLEHLPSGPVLIASRHESAFDTFVWLLLVPRCAYVIKGELARIPLLGRVMLAAGMIPVERAAGAAALRRMAADVAAALSHGRQVVVFPEGTRVAHGVPVALQPGIALLAARAGLAVVPVTTNSGRHWARRAFRKQPGVVRVVIRPSLPAGLGRDDLLAALTRDLAWERVDKSVG